MLDERTIVLTDEDGNEYPMEIICTFENEEKTKNFVLLEDPQSEGDVFPFIYNEDTGEIAEVTDEQEIELCQGVLQALIDEGEVDGKEA